MVIAGHWPLLCSNFYPFESENVSDAVVKYVGPRDDDPKLTGVAGRLERATNNMKESFPVFAALAVASMAMGVGDTTPAVIGAMLFVGFRVLFVVIYALSVPMVRSLAWGGAFAGLMMMAFALVSGSMGIVMPV